MRAFAELLDRLSLTTQNGGSQEWPKVTMYSTSWCPDCRASKRFLTSKGIPFTELDIEEKPEAAEIVRRLNNGAHRLGALVLA